MNPPYLGPHARTSLFVVDFQYSSWLSDKSVLLNRLSARTLRLRFIQRTAEAVIRWTGKPALISCGVIASRKERRHSGLKPLCLGR